MRSILCVLVLSMTSLACGADAAGIPATPSVSVPEAGAPEMPATPDAGAAKK